MLGFHLPRDSIVIKCVLQVISIWGFYCMGLCTSLGLPSISPQTWIRQAHLKKARQTIFLPLSVAPFTPWVRHPLVDGLGG